MLRQQFGAGRCANGSPALGAICEGWKWFIYLGLKDCFRVIGEDEWRNCRGELESQGGETVWNLLKKVEKDFSGI